MYDTKEKIEEIYYLIFSKKIQSDSSKNISIKILEFLKSLDCSGKSYREIIIQSYKIFIKAYFLSKKIEDIDYTDEFLKYYFDFPSKLPIQRFLFPKYEKFTHQNFPILSNEILIREIFYLFEFFSNEIPKPFIQYILQIYAKYKIKSTSTGFIPALIYLSSKGIYNRIS